MVQAAPDPTDRGSPPRILRPERARLAEALAIVRPYYCLACHNRGYQEYNEYPGRYACGACGWKGLRDAF